MWNTFRYQRKQTFTDIHPSYLHTGKDSKKSLGLYHEIQVKVLGEHRHGDKKESLVRLQQPHSVGQSWAVLAPIPPPLLTSCVGLDKLLCFSVPSFSHLIKHLKFWYLVFSINVSRYYCQNLCNCRLQGEWRRGDTIGSNTSPIFYCSPGPNLQSCTLSELEGASKVTWIKPLLFWMKWSRVSVTCQLEIGFKPEFRPLSIPFDSAQHRAWHGMSSSLYQSSRPLPRGQDFTQGYSPKG